MRTLVALSAIAFCLSAQNGQIQQPKGPWLKPREIQQPKGPWQVPKGIQAIKATDETCKHRLAIGADALFEFDRAVLNADAEQTLLALGLLIQKEGKHPISVEGHTDGVGTPAYNQDLSERRARAVESWLEAHKFVQQTSTEAKGFGKTRPIAPNTKTDGSDDPEGRQKNRRVEVVIDTCR